MTHTRDCLIVDDTLIGSRHDNRESKPMHSDLLRKVETGAAGVETCLSSIKKSLMSQVN